MMRYLIGPVPAVILSLTLLGALFMLTTAAQHSTAFGEQYSLLLAVNLLGIVALAALIIVNLWRLVRQFRARVLGSRLAMRFLGAFVLLAVLPLAIVYYFSVQFVSRGIDSWFDVRIEQALDDALLLGRASLEAIKQDVIEKLQESADRLGESQSELETISLLDELRIQGDYESMSVYTPTGGIIAYSAQEAGSLIPDTPDESILAQLRQGQVYASLEPLTGEGLQLRVVVPVQSRGVSEPDQVLQILLPLPLRYTKLGQSVQTASAEYEQLVYLRGPLKFSFVLTLTLVTLMTMLIAVWIAFFLSRRLVAPLRDLAEGTRAVAGGDYGKQLPVTSTDELGVLVQSFNEMTRQIHHAQSEARNSQREAEEQRTYLETVLRHLSSGVLSFDRKHRLQTYNATANQILGLDLSESHRLTMAEIAGKHERIEPLASIISDGLAQNVSEWQGEATVFGRHGRQVLICRGTRLPIEGPRRGGAVVVFDDVTDLIQAQRDAAWGEVARRLAHEIKNPLTPIQLSAERIRHKYLGKLPKDDRNGLDRATRTIAQQVESMKLMVNAFSNYAQPVNMQLEPVVLNRLVRDVVELHGHQDAPMDVRLQLDPAIPQISADAGRLRQVLNNVIINARDALRGVEHPVLQITTRGFLEAEGGYVELRVEDNGPGFAERQLERLFEPYVTTKEKGTGLGLAIVRRIVEEHGGTIRAENVDPHGAAIVLRIPLQAARSMANTDPNLKVPRFKVSGDPIG
ncbi:MAG: ATP-binding protein [Gammaproteobacteria bacterium]|nr:ATP-binding protein [Gammaproteobacteria bacterium]